MGDHFFLLMYATSGEERNVTRFTSYRRVEDAVAMVKEWLEKACCMDCYPAAEEAALREANGGQLPETAFLCPEVREPADLAKYNGFYDYESLGMFNLFLTPVYDTESARQFRASMNKEFGIDQEYSGRADRLLAHLETFVNSFSDPGLDYTEAEEAIRTFLVQGGFPLFDPEEEGASDIFVIRGALPPMRADGISGKWVLEKRPQSKAPGRRLQKKTPPGGLFSGKRGLVRSSRLGGHPGCSPV